MARVTNIQLRGQVYYGWFKDGAGAWRRKALSKDLPTAKQILRELQRDADLHRAGLGAIAQQRKPVEELRKAYVSDLRLRATPRHVYNTDLAIKQFLEVGKFQLVAECVVAAARRVQGELVGLGNSVRTVNKKLKHVSAMFAWAVRSREIALNPLEGLQSLPEDESTQRRRRARLSIDEVKALLAAAAKFDAGGSRRRGRSNRHIPQAPLIATALGTGFRFAELCSLTWADLHKADGQAWLTVRASSTKNGIERSNPIGDDLSQELAALRKAHEAFRRRPVNQSEPIFVSWSGRALNPRSNSARRWLSEIAKAAGLGNRHDGRVIDWHALRHTYCTMLAEAGVDLQVAAALMGHQSIEITRRVYTDTRRLPKVSAIAMLTAALRGPLAKPNAAAKNS